MLLGRLNQVVFCRLLLADQSGFKCALFVQIECRNNCLLLLTCQTLEIELFKLHAVVLLRNGAIRVADVLVLYFLGYEALLGNCLRFL